MWLRVGIVIIHLRLLPCGLAIAYFRNVTLQLGAVKVGHWPSTWPLVIPGGNRIPRHDSIPNGSGFARKLGDDSIRQSGSLPRLLRSQPHKLHA